MAQIARRGSITVHPSELVECTGTTEAGREITVYISGGEVKAIAAYLKYTDHLGHAFWHWENPDYPAGSGCLQCTTGEKI